MRKIELNERLDLSIGALAIVSNLLGEIDDSAPEDVKEYRDAVSSFLHHAVELAELAGRHPKSPNLKIV